MTTPEAITIFGAVASVAAATISAWNSSRIHEVHVAINSRMDELLKSTGTAARLEGVTQGRRDFSDARNRELK